MKPEISIIVPVYNVERYLGKCLDSILIQTFVNFEIIVVNDGSTDLSGSICDEYSKRDQRIIVIHKKNGGLSSARNAGIRVAKGKYIGFVDSDDYIDINMYKTLYKLCENTNSDIGICKFLREGNGQLQSKENDKLILELDHLEGMRQLFKGELYRFSVCNKLFKKSCFKEIQFPEGRIHEDLSTTYKLFARANKSVFTNYAGYIYVKREESILTTKYNNKRLDAFLGWEEILPFMSKNYSCLSNEFLACFAYSCVDNIHYILMQVDDKKLLRGYLNSIQQSLRRNYRKVMMNSTLTLKYKLTLTLLRWSTPLLTTSLKSRKSMKLGM